jgi:hypothetical protein
MKIREIPQPGEWILRDDDGNEFVMVKIQVIQVPEGLPIEQGTIIERYHTVGGHRISETENPDEFFVPVSNGLVRARVIGLD